MTKLKPAIEARMRIVSSERTLVPPAENHFRSLEEFPKLTRKDDWMYWKKLVRAGISDSVEEFGMLFDSLKVW